MANRVGLAPLTEFCFAVTTLAVRYYYSFLSNDTAKAKLFTCSNQCSVFLYALETLVKDLPNFKCAVNRGGQSAT